MDFTAVTHPTLDRGDEPEAPAPDTTPDRALAVPPAGPLASPRFVAISRSLQRIFGPVVEQPLPERLADLIHQVDHLVLRRKDGR